MSAIAELWQRMRLFVHRLRLRRMHVSQNGQSRRENRRVLRRINAAYEYDASEEYRRACEEEYVFRKLLDKW